MTKRRSRLAFPLKLMMLVTVFMAVVVTVALLISPGAQAKTYISDSAKNIFVYAKNGQDEDILVKILTLEELQKNLSHGQLDGNDTGKDYYISYSDNYPTTGYAQAQGFTLMELFDYVNDNSDYVGTGLSFTGTSATDTDYVDLMATDGPGTYAKSYTDGSTKYTYTYDNLYNVDRYYFEDFYNKTYGWQTGWELNDGYIVEMDDYSGVAYYADKTSVIATGVASETILATDVRSGRTTLDGETSYYEEGFASYIKANNGIVAGCINDGLKTDYALNILIPQSEAGIYSGERTAYSNFKWIYTIRLRAASTDDLESKGTVAPVEAEYKLVDGTLYVTLSCETQDAQIYYGLSYKAGDSNELTVKACPQTLYVEGTTVISFEGVTEESLETNPVKFNAIAVKEGYADSGMVSIQYKQGAPGFNASTQTALGSSLTITASSGVSSEFWRAWSSEIHTIVLKPPSGDAITLTNESSYITIDDENRCITLDGSLFTMAGNWELLIYSKGYAVVSRSATFKAAPPSVADVSAALYEAITITFSDQSYYSGLSLSIKRQDADDSAYSTINQLTRSAGQVTINQNYYRSSGCQITGAGTYTLLLTNSGYIPATQTITLTITDALAYDESDVYSFNFSEDHYCGDVGDTFTLKLSLSGTKASFDFYGGTYQLKIDSNYLEVIDGDISTYNLFKYKTDDDGNIIFYVNYKTTATTVIGSLDVATIRFRITSDKFGVALRSGDAALYSDYGNLPNTVTGGFAVGGRCATKNFTDCNTSAWYHQFVDYAVGMGLYAGTSATTFEPTTSMTRGMLVTVMANMSGEDMNAYKGASRFSDVKSGTYYEGPVEWAATHNVATGIGGGLFAPDNPVTREQIAVILYQYETLYLNHEIPTPGDTAYRNFTDTGAASSWAVTALKWATENGIMNGSSSTTLNPTGNASRAEVATMLRNYQLFFVGIADQD